MERFQISLLNHTLIPFIFIWDSWNIFYFCDRTWLANNILGTLKSQNLRRGMCTGWLSAQVIIISVFFWSRERLNDSHQLKIIISEISFSSSFGFSCDYRVVSSDLSPAWTPDHKTGYNNLGLLEHRLPWMQTFFSQFSIWDIEFVWNLQQLLYHQQKPFL